MTNEHTRPKALEALGELDVATFLSEYWQKKPLLVKNAFTNFNNPLSADELAGLSLEDESQSRLIVQTDEGFEQRHGPFDEQAFNSLPDSNWTLLVQNLDSLDPGVNELLAYFRFLPNWRLDDVMASYASDNGTVGPHFDYYDVFLLQGLGKRRWRIGQTCNNDSELLTGQSLKILKEFTCTADWQVEAGDLIYIPAKHAHWGEAIDESITYSIGFRAPSHLELLLEATQAMSEGLNESHRYRDGDEITRSDDPGLISTEAIERIRHTLLTLVDQPEELSNWIGEFATQLKPGLEPEHLPLDFAQEEQLNSATNSNKINSNIKIALSPFCRAAYINNNQLDSIIKNVSGSDNKDVSCYINGERYQMTQSLAQRLSQYLPFSPADISQKDLIVLKNLTHRNYIVRV